MNDAAIAYWEHWLAEIATVLRGTGTGPVAASLWADLIGMPHPDRMRAVRKAVLLDEQCSRLGRVLPGDVVRMLRDNAMTEVPDCDEAIGEIWTQVSRVGRYAALEGFDSVAAFSHPVIGAMADAAGWVELCDSTERQVMDGQLRRYHETIVARWRRGSCPPPPRGLRCTIAGAEPPPQLAAIAGLPLAGHRLDDALREDSPRLTSGSGR